MLAVHTFYAKAAKDPIVGPYFDELDLDQQATKQVAFLSRAMGGPVEYQGRDLREAHRNLSLGDREFDRIVELLVESLREQNAPSNLIDEVVERVAPTRPEVLNQ